MTRTFKVLSLLIIVCVAITACNRVNKDELPEIDFGSELSLDFSPFTTLTGPFWGQDVGFKGNTSTNELFFTYKSNPSEPGVFDAKQVMIKYDLANNTTKELRSKLVGGGSRYIHVIPPEVKVISNTGIGTYPIDISAEPTWVPHTGTFPTSYSRFGSVLYGGAIYVIGGDLNTNDPDGILSNKIRKWNSTTSRFEVVAKMPHPKTWTSAEVVDNKLYIFGGREQYRGDSPPQNSVFIYDFATSSFETIELPEAVSWTFTAVYKDKILVSGQLLRDQPDPDQIADRDIFFQVFDPVDNSFHEVDISLSDDGLNMIHDMALVGDQVFLIYGIPNDERENEFESPIQDWTIQRATINF